MTKKAPVKKAPVKKAPAKKVVKKASPRVKAGTSRAEAERKKKLYVEAYITNGGNKTQAAVEAGYPPGRAAEKAAERLSKDVVVQQMIAERAEAVANKYELTTELAARSIYQELTFDPGKLYREDGSLKDVTELDEDTRMALTSVEFEQLGDKDSPVIVRKMKWAPRHQAREQLMKHLGMFEKDNAQKSPLDGLPRDVLKMVVDKLRGA